MPAFFLALLGAALATIAGREAVRVARLSAAFPGSPMPLAAAGLACIAAAGFAAWLGGRIAGEFLPEAKTMLVAIALLLASLELAILRPAAAPAEPTRSLGAVVLVLCLGQLGSSTSFIVFALAIATAAPWLAAAGGVAGGGAVLAIAWAAAGEWEARVPLVAVRRGVAALLALAAIVVGLSARGLLG